MIKTGVDDLIPELWLHRAQGVHNAQVPRVLATAFVSWHLGWGLPVGHRLDALPVDPPRAG